MEVVSSFFKSLGETLKRYDKKLEQRTPFYEEAYCINCKKVAKETGSYHKLSCMDPKNPFMNIQPAICAKINRKAEEIIINQDSEEYMNEAFRGEIEERQKQMNQDRFGLEL